MNKKVLVIGAGPAGLSACYSLLKKDAGYSITLIEKCSLLGGLSKTVKHNGFYIDVGGHRFYTKCSEVKKFWNEILPDGSFKERPRKSRIFFRSQFLEYPLNISECLSKLGVAESFKISISYLKSLLQRKIPAKKSYEDWVVRHMGERLFQLFFKDYTEKVWGRSCKHISEDWADQRLNKLSLFSLLKDQLPTKECSPKTLIKHFHYPDFGPGQLWETCHKICNSLGLVSRFESEPVSIKKVGERYDVTIKNKTEVNVETFDHVISTMPLPNLCSLLDEGKLFKNENLSKLTFRHFSTVALMGKGKVNCDDNWIYIQDNGFKVARIQIYNNWAPTLVPDESSVCIGLEYFHDDKDELGVMSEADLKKLAMEELQKLPFLSQSFEVKDSIVIRARNAYPIYHLDYKDDVNAIREILTRNYPGIHVAGRNGMHRYNNQDHSILTGFICAENILSERNVRNPWNVNQDAVYLESASS